MNRVELHHGDCLEVLRGMPDNSVDSIVTDPPYGLSDHKPADVVACMTAWLAGEPYLTNKRGFMGKTWDSWVPGPEVWRECLRVLKPGGHVLAFAGTRSMDLMSMAVRLAGFELRDSIGYANDGGGAALMAWCFGSGFPKSMDVSKAIDKAAGAEREHIAGPKSGGMAALNKSNAAQGYRDAAYYDDGNMMLSNEPVTEAARQWQGWGTALKPAWEPVILARKPLSEGTVAANVLAHGTGALNIDGCRIGHASDEDLAMSLAKNPGRADTVTSDVYGAGRPQQSVNTAGRWPANLIHDGSDEVLAAFPTSASPWIGNPNTGAKGGKMFGGSDQAINEKPEYRDAGSAARFFYCAKASKKDRGEGNEHPTVKPTDLMAYLCRLVTPPGGTVLDPFMGSGSTGKAALQEGFRFVGIEREAQYLEIARARIEAERTKPQPDLFSDAMSGAEIEPG